MSKVIAKNIRKSTWTPLNNEEANNKLYEERRGLIKKWFSKWNTEQRTHIVDDLVVQCTQKQLAFARNCIGVRLPTTQNDFTRVVPRVITIYILAYLDPRSLSRCSRVCWYWKFLSELDQLWMTKCLRLGWYLPTTPSPHESGLWKSNYIEHIKSLQVLHPQEPRIAIDLEALKIKKIEKVQKTPPKKALPPWKGSDPRPTDTWRNNYIENEDDLDGIQQLRKKGYYSSESKEIMKNAQSKIRTGQSAVGPSLTRRSQSMTKLHPSKVSMSVDENRWAQFPPSSKNKLNHTSLGIQRPTAVVTFVARPAPVSYPATKPTPIDNTTTVTEMFPHQPWKMPDNVDSEED